MENIKRKRNRRTTNRKNEEMVTKIFVSTNQRMTSMFKTTKGVRQRCISLSTKRKENYHNIFVRIINRKFMFGIRKGFPVS